MIQRFSMKLHWLDSWCLVTWSSVRPTKPVSAVDRLSRKFSRQVSRILVIHPLINHYRGGVHGNLVGLSRGAFDNFLHFEVDQIFNQAAVGDIAEVLTSLPFPFRMP